MRTSISQLTQVGSLINKVNHFRYFWICIRIRKINKVMVQIEYNALVGNYVNVRNDLNSNYDVLLINELKYRKRPSSDETLINRTFLIFL